VAKRRVRNPLALAVLTFLSSKPMYPYELASVLRATHKEETIKINWGSLYTVVQNLEKHGLIKEAGTTRQGGRPERTAYAITDAGRAEMHDWLCELLRDPQKEYPLFATALSLVGALPPEEVVEMLEQRLVALDAELAAQQAELAGLHGHVPRLFLIENEYLNAVRQAEAAWVRSLLADIRSGAIGDVDQWRDFHRTGEVPEELANLLASVAREGEDREEPDRTD
jgi:DNA-binding PadR family transcriptional regulator